MAVDNIIRSLGLDIDHLDQEGYYALCAAKRTLKDSLKAKSLTAEERENIKDAIEYLECWIEVEQGSEDEE